MKRTPIRRVSKRRAGQASEYTAFVLGIKDRDGWRCAYCRTQRGALDPHHVIKRSQGGAVLDPSNVITLCRACHDWTDAAYSSPEGRLCVDSIGHGQFLFAVVHASSKWTAPRCGVVARTAGTA